MASLLTDLENLTRRCKVVTETETGLRFIQFLELVDSYQRKMSALDKEVCRLQF